MLNNENPRLSENNFDLLRLLFAGIVVFVHAYILSGYPELEVFNRMLSSSAAVRCFFVVSGFLIFMSFERSSSFSSYISKRIRRILPAYLTIVLFCAILLFFISSKSISAYFSIEWMKYFLANITFLNFLRGTLPGVFDTNIYQTVNGALWTLKIEVMFYVSVPIFVFLFRRYNKIILIIFIYLLSVLWAETFLYLGGQTGRNIYYELGRQLPGQLRYFISGAFFYYYLHYFERNFKYFLGISVPILLLNQYYSLPLLEPAALASVVCFFALFLYVGKFGKFGDFSYGVYILHCPIIQLSIHFGVFRHNSWLFLTWVIALTTLGAIIMWHLIEKRFLLRNSHYVAANP